MEIPGNTDGEERSYFERFPSPDSKKPKILQRFPTFERQDWCGVSSYGLLGGPTGNRQDGKRSLRKSFPDSRHGGKPVFPFWTKAADTMRIGRNRHVTPGAKPLSTYRTANFGFGKSERKNSRANTGRRPYPTILRRRSFRLCGSFRKNIRIDSGRTWRKIRRENAWGEPRSSTT